ncbi:pilin [Pseudonocardia nigra]|uniref:pilin n=1 Tax=Pseudonocardia nigra TaxID=1921578 RepID=UPI001C5DFF12|nr:pilin [Pseudonocardia nigra]
MNPTPTTHTTSTTDSATTDRPSEPTSAGLVTPADAGRTRERATDPGPTTSYDPGGEVEGPVAAAGSNCTPAGTATAAAARRGGARTAGLLLLLLLALLVCSVSSPVRAAALTLAAAPGAAPDAPDGGVVLAQAESVDQVLTNVRNWLMGILAALATVFATIGGIRYVMANGDPGEVEKAKLAFRSAGIGYALAALAPLLITILQGLVGM